MNTLDDAMEFAVRYHDGQHNIYDGEPYILHVMRVARAVRNMGMPVDTQAIAWLHDVLEDTDATLLDLQKKFGHEIATNVAALTKKKGQSNQDYYESLTYFPKAAIVKIQDIHDNFRRNHLIADEATRLRMAAKYSLGLDILGSHASYQNIDLREQVPSALVE